MRRFRAGATLDRTATPARVLEALQTVIPPALKPVSPVACLIAFAEVQPAGDGLAVWWEFASFEWVTTGTLFFAALLALEDGRLGPQPDLPGFRARLGHSEDGGHTWHSLR